jgi:MFS transporter, ACS family, hexuronate transporter
MATIATDQEAKPPAETTKEGGAVWAVAIVATLGMSVSYIDRQTLAAIAPQVCKALTIDNTHYGWLLSAFSMAYLVGAPIAGIVVDRLGARRGFAAAVLVWSIVAGAHALAVSFATLFALRIMLGTAEAPSFPSAAQAIRRALPGARRPLAYGLLFTGSSIGAIIAAKLAVRLETAFGFRGAFLGTAILGTIWIPVWLVVTRGFGLDAPAKREAVHQSTGPKESPFTVITSPPVLRSIIAIIGSAPSLMFVLNWTSKYLDAEFKVPKAEIGNYLIAAPILFDVGAIGFGYIASQREIARAAAGEKGAKTHSDLLLLSMILSAALALAPFFASSPWMGVLFCAVSACGGGGIYALVTADMLSRVPVHRTSVAGGMTAAAQSLAHVIAAPLVGWTIDVSHSHRTALLGLGIIVIPTTVAFVYWPSLRSRQPT